MEKDRKQPENLHRRRENTPQKLRAEAGETAADLKSACSDLFLPAGIAQFQPLGPDVFPPRVRVRAGSAREAVPADAGQTLAVGSPNAAAGAAVRCFPAVCATG